MSVARARGIAEATGGVGHRQLDDAVAASPADRLARLVGGDRHEPRPESVGLAQVAELAPGDEPGGGDRLVGEVGVAADDEAHPDHVVVMRGHDPREGRLVAIRRLTDEVAGRVTEPGRQDGHVPQMLATRSSDSSRAAPAHRDDRRRLSDRTRAMIHGVRRRRDEAPGRPPVRGGRRRPRGHRAHRPARPAHAVGRVQPGPAAGRRHGSRAAAARSPGSAARRSTRPTSGRGSASAPRSSSRASARRSTTAATRSPTRSTRTATEIEWPVPFWWVDIGATMQNIMLAAVNEGLGCGFVGPDDRAAARVPRHPRRVRADRGHAGRAAAAGRPVTEPQARLGAVRGVRALGALGLRLRISAAAATSPAADRPGLRPRPRGRRSSRSGAARRRAPGSGSRDRPATPRAGRAATTRSR